MSYDDTRFGAMFARYGGWPRILTSTDFILGVSLGLVAAAIVAHLDTGVAFVSDSSVILIGIAVAMVATTIAGLSILASISDPRFVKFARNTPVGSGNVYDNIVFVFWYAATLSFCSLLIDLAGSFLVRFFRNPTLADWVAGAMLVFALYSILAVALLLGTITRWGFFRGIVVSEEL
jgi:hypothetical protein